MKQVFEVTITDIDNNDPWTEAQLKEILKAMMNGETVEVKETKNV